MARERDQQERAVGPFWGRHARRFPSHTSNTSNASNASNASNKGITRGHHGPPRLSRVEDPTNGRQKIEAISEQTRRLLWSHYPIVLSLLCLVAGFVLFVTGTSLGRTDAEQIDALLQSSTTYYSTFMTLYVLSICLSGFIAVIAVVCVHVLSLQERRVSVYTFGGSQGEKGVLWSSRKMRVFIVVLIGMSVVSLCYLVLEIGATWSLCVWYKELHFATEDLAGIDTGEVNVEGGVQRGREDGLGAPEVALCPASSCLNLKAISFIVTEACVCDPETIYEVHRLSSLATRNFYIALGGACGLFVSMLVLGMLCALSAAQLKLRIDHWEQFLPGDLEGMIKEDRYKDLERGEATRGGVERRSIEMVASLGGGHGKDGHEDGVWGDRRVPLHFPDVEGIHESGGMGDRLGERLSTASVGPICDVEPETTLPESWESETIERQECFVEIEGADTEISKAPKEEDEEVLSAYKPQRPQLVDSEQIKFGRPLWDVWDGDVGVPNDVVGRRRQNASSREQHEVVRASRIVDAYGRHKRRSTDGSSGVSKFRKGPKRMMESGEIDDGELDGSSEGLRFFCDGAGEDSGDRNPHLYR